MKIWASEVIDRKHEKHAAKLVVAIIISYILWSLCCCFYCFIYYIKIEQLFWNALITLTFNHGVYELVRWWDKNCGKVQEISRFTYNKLTFEVTVFVFFPFSYLWYDDLFFPFLFNSVLRDGKFSFLFFPWQTLVGTCDYLFHL